MNTSLLETRFTPQPSAGLNLQQRSQEGSTLAGYGAVYYVPGQPDTEYWLYEGIMVERIARGCFDRAIREDDVRSFFNHDENRILGRKAAGTLQLYSDKIGLRYEIDVPNTTVGRDVHESVRRGDVTGSSFMFMPTVEDFFEDDYGIVVRVLREVKLWEVGPVVFPAYAASTSEARDRLLKSAARHGVRLRADLPKISVRQRMLALRARDL